MNDPDKKKSYQSIFEELSLDHSSSTEKNGHAFPGVGEEEEAHYFDEGEANLTDELDHQVLMHRDAHFGGDFKVMLTYYQEEHLGVYPEFDLDRIAYLAEVEAQLGQNLASVILTVAEAEKVARARRAYEMLKEIYEQEEEEKSPFPRLLADLILTESEEPEQEIEAVVSQGSRIVPELIQMVRSDETYDPLFPGYGYAPYLAIICLGKIKDPSAIIPLFETLGREMAFDEEVILGALREIDAPAQTFLLDVLQGRPITKDVIQAAYALAVFADQVEVAHACFEQLRDKDVIEHSLLRSYLLNNCEGLRNTPLQKALEEMGHDPEIPSDFQTEIQNLIRSWQ
ncbi:MAG: hypothetical protein S4CHLAM2_04660 [Chlamydiales bacterium]|nr:hypothetical protein [Chlamydiales bacterium]